MRPSILVLVPVLVVLAGVPPSAALNLPASSASTAVACQKAINKFAETFLAARQRVLDKCATKISGCVQTTTSEAKQLQCQASVGEKCRKEIGTLSTTEAKLETKVLGQCRALGLANLVSDAGLGFGRVQDLCILDDGTTSDGELSFNDPDAIVECVASQVRRTADRLFAVAEPRARELIATTPPSDSLLYFPDLPDYGGNGDGLGDPQGLGQATQDCVAQLAKGGSGFAKASLASVAACTNALFACEQKEPNKTKPKLQACRDKAAKRCAQQAAKLATQRTSTQQKIGKNCTIAGSGYEALRSPQGANLGALNCECDARVGVDDLTTFGEYQRCFDRQHECRAADLARLAMPRAAELLGNVGMTLEDLLCEQTQLPASAFVARTSERVAFEGLGARRFVNIRNAFFGPLRKHVDYVRNGARTQTAGLPRRITPLNSNTRLFTPGGTKRVYLKYSLGGRSTSGRVTVDPAPRLVVTVQRLDGSFVGNDSFEVDLEPAQEEVELELTFPTDVPTCNFRLAFATATGSGVSEYAPLDQEQAKACDPDPDGLKIDGEECDDGNLVDGDACDSNCTIPHCGNGILTPGTGEECDDGNLNDGDGCEDDCTITVPATPTLVATPSRTATRTPTPIDTATTTLTPTRTATTIPTPTLTPTRTTTTTPTRTPTPSPTVTAIETPVVTITATDPDAAEGGADLGELTVTRTGDTTSTLTVQYTIGGTATDATDYANIASSITIPAGATTAKRTITPINDALVEGPETVILTINDDPSYDPGAATSATVTIADNPVPIVSITATDAAASEPGLDPGEFTFTRVGNLSLALTVSYTVGGTATNGSDYAPIATSITFPAGAGTATRAIVPRNDGSVEGSETALLTVLDGAHYDLGTPSAATVTIGDNIVPTVSIVASDATAAEIGPDPGEFTFSRTGDLAFQLIVTYSIGGTTSNGNDYDPIGGSITIPAGATTIKRAIVVRNDPFVEGSETVLLTVLDAPDYDPGTSAVATVTITDNVAPVVTIAATDGAASEVGLDPGEFTFTRVGDTTFALTVQYTIGGTATDASDYTNITGTITIPVGATTAKRVITPINDALVEGSETVILTINDDPNYDPGAANAATVTIADHVVPVVSITATDAAASEIGIDPGEFTFTRTGDISLPLPVSYSVGGTATNNADYNSISTSITIPAGAATATRAVVPKNDGGVEGAETVLVTILDGANYDLGASSAATVTIADNVPPTVSISASDATASEIGLDPGEFTFTRTGDTTFALRVNFIVGGTATNGADYDRIDDAITIPAGSTTVKRAIVVRNDGGVEGSETVLLTLLDDPNYDLAAPTVATVTIDDNVPPVVTITATDANASEIGLDPGEFTITRTGDTTFALTIAYTIAGSATNSSDYNNIPATITIPAGSATTTRAIVVKNDALVEGTETAQLTLLDDANYDVGAPSTASVTIGDNVVPTVSITASDATGSEIGLDSGEFTFTRTGDTTFALTVSYSIGGTATNISDYSQIFGSITIPAGSPTATLTVAVKNDALVEGSETVLLTLLDGANYDLVAPTAATVTIADNAVPIVTVTATDAVASEVGPEPGTCTFSRTGDTTFALTVSYTRGGSATNDIDYTFIATTIAIPAGITTAPRTITPKSDPTPEGTETVILTLTDGASYDVGTNSVCTITISD